MKRNFDKRPTKKCSFTVKAAADGYIIFKRFKTIFLLTNIYNLLRYAVIFI